MRGWPVHRPTHAGRNRPQNKRQQRPPTKPKSISPRRVAPERVKESPSDIGATSQEKKQHRHSGIFRVADLGPGTMPRGKYPESPAPAGSHALISRTPTPGGMLHANLGLPRPTPRNFQPPLPRFPSRLSPRRMSGTTVGRILSHPLPRPTHAYATALRTNSNSAPPLCVVRLGMRPAKLRFAFPPRSKNLNPSHCRSSVWLPRHPAEHESRFHPTSPPKLFITHRIGFGAA